MQLKEGSELQNGKYRILRVLGQGGFGITYLAENIYFEKMVAIKEFFPKDFCGRDNTSHLTLGTQNNAETVEKLKARFLKEARNIAKLDHPGIIKIHDIFEENNTAYYVMDYINGESLSDIIKTNGPLPISQAIKYVINVGEALEYIHTQQMTHFDVKPANIMVRKSDDKPVLIDFGLSNQYDHNGDATSTIMQGVTHGFSPIELYSTNSVTTFSPQTDVYSLGATLYYLLTGTVPPSASQVLEEGLHFPNEISPNICSAIKRAMSANRAKRYKTVKNFCRTLKKSISTDVEEYIGPSVSFTEETSPDETKLVEENNNSQYIAEVSQNSKDTNAESQEYYYEEEPSKWDKFVNRICGTNNLVNANQIPNSKKGVYLSLLLILIIAAGMFPIGGWLFMLAIYKYIRNSSQRIIFADYLHPWDHAYDYTKRKAIAIITLVICIPVVLGIFILSITESTKKDNVAECVTHMSAECPYTIFDVQVSSFSFVDGNIIATLHSKDSVHVNRDFLNQLNIELWKPLLLDKEFPHYNIAKDNSITFKCYNNGIERKPIVITTKEFNRYKNLTEQSRGKEFLSSFMVLENTYLPYDIGENVEITNVSIENIANANGEYLTFTLLDDKRIMEKEFGDSLNYKISSFLPINFPYLAESVANSIQGIGYRINTSNGVVVEDILYTSSDLKGLFSQQ